jgi:hypothetical protein
VDNGLDNYTTICPVVVRLFTVLTLRRLIRQKEQHNFRIHLSTPISLSKRQPETFRASEGHHKVLEPTCNRNLYGNSRITLLTVPISSELIPRLHDESRYLCDLVSERPDSTTRTASKSRTMRPSTLRTVLHPPKLHPLASDVEKLFSIRFVLRCKEEVNRDAVIAISNNM